MVDLFRYRTASGEEPFTEWLQSMRDKQVQAKLRIRLKRIESGNFGDCESVGEGVLELREHMGAGYRVYLGRHGQSIVILLSGGSTKTQGADIKTAKDYWADWKRRQHEEKSGRGGFASRARASRASSGPRVGGGIPQGGNGIAG